MRKRRRMPELKGFFSDETEQFRSPMEADPGCLVTIRFRALCGDADEVFLCHDEEQILMRPGKPVDGFVYYHVGIRVGESPYRYSFLIRSGDETWYYSRTGAACEPVTEHFFCIYPGFHTPAWARGAVFYQIFIDRFCNGSPSNDVLPGEYRYLDLPVHREDSWDTVPDGGMDVANFYGGDLQGVIDRLDYLADLGVEAIYFNPLFVSPSNHKYDAQDYDHIDPHLGPLPDDEGALLPEDGSGQAISRRYIARTTRPANLAAADRLFARLVREAHVRGIRVVLDGVFNHCGSFHKWMDRERIYEGTEGYEKGAYLDQNSPWHDYFRFGEKGSWPCNDDYEGWWDHKTLPKLNYEDSANLRKEILRIARKWLGSPYRIDGWRLDVAADLGHSEECNHSFWKRFRQEVKKVNPDALILAEHYGDPSAWLMGDEWDTVMNYDAFMEPVSWFLTGMEKHSDGYSEELDGNAEQFGKMMWEHMAALPAPALLTAMNELDNHDHSRFLTRTAHHVGRVDSLGVAAASEGTDRAVLQEAVVIQMTWPGAPTVYYGDEAGLCGFTDPDNRRPFPWGREDKELQRFYKDIIALHKRYAVLRTGSLILLYQDTHVLGYARFDRHEQIFVFLNNRQEDCEIDAPVWPAGLSREEGAHTLQQIFSSGWYGYSLEKKAHTATNGRLHLHLSPREALVLRCAAKKH